MQPADFVIGSIPASQRVGACATLGATQRHVRRQDRRTPRCIGPSRAPSELPCQDCDCGYMPVVHALCRTPAPPYPRAVRFLFRQAKSDHAAGIHQADPAPRLPQAAIGRTQQVLQRDSAAVLARLPLSRSVPAWLWKLCVSRRISCDRTTLGCSLLARGRYSRSAGNHDK